jgi:hypothetical protein
MVFVEYRLLAGDKVDDCEAPHSERDTCVDEQALGVRAAMSHPLTHCVEQLLRAIGWRRVRIETSPSGYSAHYDSTIHEANFLAHRIDRLRLRLVGRCEPASLQAHPSRETGSRQQTSQSPE